MNNNNQHKPGYKHTTLGWIPEDWEVKELEKCFILSSGRTKPIDISQFKIDEYLYPVYGGNGIVGYSKEFNIEGNNIIIGRVGEYCGVTRFISIKAWITDNALFTRKITGDIDVSYLAYKLQQENISKLRSKGGQPLVSQTPIYLHAIAISTSLSEQQKIATILSTWDKAITNTQQLINQLQQRNKGLMHQLLTGRKRLRDYSGKWQRMHIFNIAREISLKNKADKDLTVLSCTKYDGLVPSLEYFGRRVFGSDTSTYKVVPSEHFAYATNHIEEGSIGYQSIFKEALISPMYTVFKTTIEVNDDFLYKLLKSHQYIHQYCKRMEGSIDRRGGLRWDEFSKIPVYLPGLKEQAAIASVLNEAVDEVKLYAQQLASLQQQKKGLMQKLLTGEIRVKVN